MGSGVCFGGPFWSAAGCPIGRGEQAARVCRWWDLGGSWTQGKMLVYALQRHSCKRKAREGQGSKGKGCIAWWKLEITRPTRDKRQEIDERDSGKRVKLNYQQRPVHATSKKEPALLQRGTATGRSLGVAHTFPVQQRHASGQRCRKY